MKPTVLLLILLCFIQAAAGYDVVLKNGKTLKGTIIMQNDQMIVLRDASGLVFNLKRSTIDPEKTARANAIQQLTTPVPQTPSQKKAARVITVEDLQKLREKYDLNQGMYSKEAQTQTQPQSQRSEAEGIGSKTDSQPKDWETETKELAKPYHDEVASLREKQEALLRECIGDRYSAGTTYVDRDGQIIGYGSTLGQASNPAACYQIYTTQNQIDELKETARREGVPIGWMDAW